MVYLVDLEGRSAPAKRTAHGASQVSNRKWCARQGFPDYDQGRSRLSLILVGGQNTSMLLRLRPNKLRLGLVYQDLHHIAYIFFFLKRRYSLFLLFSCSAPSEISQ